MQLTNIESGRAPQGGPGRHSCLVVGLVLVAVTLLAGVAIIGLVFMLGNSDPFALGDSIGVVEVDGVIIDSKPIIDTLIEFRRSDNIKAIILRIDSPGGGVAATQEIYQEIERTKKSKKIIASLGSIAASGGLYVASPADVIVANPATITGSIGVIMEMMNIEALYGKIGVTPVVIKSGQFKDIGSSARPMTEEERKLLQEWWTSFITSLFETWPRAGVLRKKQLLISQTVESLPVSKLLI